MVQNLDKIISDLKFVNEKLINRLDKIEPVLAKDKYQIEDVDFLITSTPIKNKLPIPVIEVNYFLNNNDFCLLGFKFEKDNE